MSRRLAILCGVLAVSFGLQLWLSAAPAIPLRASLAHFPAALGDWTVVRERTLEEDVLAVLRTDEYLSRTYANASGQLADLYIGYYENQSTGETVHSPRNCLPGWGWQIRDSGRVRLDGIAATPVEINRYIVEKDQEQALVLYWYQAHGRIIASEYWGKLYLVWDSLARHRREGALVRIVIPVRGDAASAEASGLSFVHPLLKELPRFLPD